MIVFIAKEGIPFIVIPLIVAVLFGAFHIWPAAAVFVILAAFMAYFFRDPDRVIPSGKGLIVAAADGRITRIGENDAGKVVSIFLSPLDVHINRSPIGGRISSITYTEGKKLPATSNDASFVNERNALEISGDGITVTCIQIAGILARRIVCWPRQGDQLQRGEKFGLIKFSSRTDILMPRDVDLKVQVGDKVRGGETVIAEIL